MENSKGDCHLREAIEVCRLRDLAAADLADVAHALSMDPRMSRARRNIEGWDSAITVAMDKIRVPEGLEERILARLAGRPSLAVSVTSAVRAADAGPEPSTATAEVSREPDSSSARTLTYWSGVGISAIIAAALIIAAGYWLQLGSEFGLDQLARLWQDELTDEWQPIVNAPPEFPFPADVMRVAAAQWQWIGKLTSTPVVAYELTDGKTTALLYAARMTREGLSNAPPERPRQGASGQAIGYWRSGKIIYVLVVNDGNRYHAFVRPASTPLAVLLPIRFNRPTSGCAGTLSSSRKIA